MRAFSEFLLTPRISADRNTFPPVDASTSRIFARAASSSAF